jgi:hypothetical protein
MLRLTDSGRALLDQVFKTVSPETALLARIGEQGMTREACLEDIRYQVHHVRGDGEAAQRFLAVQLAAEMRFIDSCIARGLVRED